MTAATQERPTDGHYPVNGHPVLAEAGTVPLTREPEPQQAAPPAAATQPQPHQSPAPAQPKVSKRVQRWTDQAAEDEAMLVIGNNPALFRADSDKVIKERRRAAEAYKLHQLAADPARAALRDARARRAVGILGGTLLIGALGWSTANVQITVASSFTPASPAWWLAFLVEPVVSGVLLLIFGVRAYLAATKGVTIIDDKLRKCEIVALAITLTCNSWLYLPFVANHFSFIELLVHSIGPVVAIMLVTVIPILWNYLTLDWTGENAPKDDTFDEHLTVARQLIADQVVPVTPTRGPFERAMRTELKSQGKRGINTAAAQRVWRHLVAKAATS